MVKSLTWLNSNEAAQLENKSERTIRRNAEKGKYGKLGIGYRHVKGVGGNSGKNLEVALESLSEPAQARYYGEQPPKKDFMQFTGKERAAADFKALAVGQYQYSELTTDDFIEWFNDANPEQHITRDQLFRWQRKFQDGDFAALVDGRGGHNRGKSSISDEAWNFFINLIKQCPAATIRRLWELTQVEYPNIPSTDTFERRYNKLSKYEKLALRGGEKEMKDHLPSMKRDKTTIQSNDIWFSDHHLMDVFVRNKLGQAVRPWLTVFFDARSNKVISYIARDADPNASVVKKCFRLGVENNGLPNECYFDNGKDYTSKDFCTDYPTSLVNQLGIGMIYATKFHGQAKTVERFFGTLESRLNKLLPTYAGKDAKSRPEHMRISNAKIAEIAPDIDDYLALLDGYINEYNMTNSRGQGMNGQCPDLVYYDNLLVKREVNDHEALRLLCGTSQERVVHKNGVSILNNEYFNTELSKHYGEKVIVTYDPDNIDKVAVFNMDNRAICMAQAKRVTPFRATTEADYRQAQKEKKAARAAMKKYTPGRTMDVQSLIARKQLLETAFEQGRDTKAIEYMNPQISQNSKTLKASESTSRKRIREEDNVLAAFSDLKHKEA